ncbi:MAG: DUF3360 domain-containing protein [Clostridia bacterium]|nr:DUF3360 domain-containing protein [Clostridia bacterium]
MQKESRKYRILHQDLYRYQIRKWRINIPFKSYQIRPEDTIPAVSGLIGKIALVTAFAAAWANGLGIKDPGFVIENVRLEMVLGSLIALIFCSILHPLAAPPGTLAPLIPIIPVMAASGVHPLPFALLVGLLGGVVLTFRLFTRILEVNGPGTKCGIVLLFGLLGLLSSAEKLRNWSISHGGMAFLITLLMAGMALLLLSTKYKLKWLMIPLSACLALGISFLYGFFPLIETKISLPIINPQLWWNEKWGIGWGITLDHFINAFPFAILVIMMWPGDILAVKAIQEANYPKDAKNAILNTEATLYIVLIRNILGTVAGGAQTASVWRSFMISLSVIGRPIGGSVLLLGFLGILTGILGFPIDILSFPPLVYTVLLFGIYIPFLEVGLKSINSFKTLIVVVGCLAAGILLNPLIGWAFAVALENIKLKKSKLLFPKMYIKGGIITILIITVSLLSSLIILI